MSTDPQSRSANSTEQKTFQRVAKEVAEGTSRDAGADDGSEPIPPEYSEDAIAQQFTAAHRDDLKYVDGRGLWLEYSDGRWGEENTLKAFDLCRLVARAAGASALRRTDLAPGVRNKIATQLCSAKCVAAVERLTRADRNHAEQLTNFDRNPLALNTPAGTWDLETGIRRPHAAGDLITRITRVAADGACPRFLKFLREVTAEDDELVQFLKRVAGYVLTGITREHALFFFWGAGANGKSTFLNILHWILGNYAVAAPMETFTDSNTERHPTDLAMLHSARLVLAQETDAGRSWALAKVKTMTSGDPISARFMRRDFFEYIPQFKLVLAGNHKPGLRNVDEAIRRRMHLIPFTVTIPPERRDPNLLEKLREEAPGILMWAIEGCLEWQSGGLAAPKAVLEATSSYLENEDVIALWEEQCTAQSPGGFLSNTELHASYKSWAEEHGEKFLATNRFTKALEERGWQRQRKAAARGFEGVALVAQVGATTSLGLGK